MFACIPSNGFGCIIFGNIKVNYLIIQTAFPGDAILTLPLIQELKSQDSAANIDVLCIPATQIIFEVSPSVNQVIVYDKKNKHKGIKEFIGLATKLRKNRYDKIYSPHRSARSALLSFITKAKESISFNISSLKFLYKTKVKYRSDFHEVQRNLSLLGKTYLGDSWKILPDVRIEDEIRDFANRLTSKINFQNVIVIAPGSVWETKKYPVEYFKEIASSLTELGYTVILVGSDEGTKLAEIIKGDNKNIFNLCGQLNFLHSISLMQKSKLVISNDSAPTHLAMCADVPVLTIYCSTVREFGFYPYNEGSKSISFDELDCKPCGIHGFNKCPKDHFKCGFELKPSKVLSEINYMLEKRH